MNTKIYFNENYLELVEQKLQDPSNQPFKTKTPDNTEIEILNKKIDELTNVTNNLTSIIKIDNLEFVLEQIKARFSFIQAAGGLIQKQNSFLFIHRLGKWDLPKGKLDLGESVENCAVRECEEECGVKQLQIVKKLPSTFHIYPNKGALALKQTHWFYMKTDFSGTLTPQLEEDINEVKWMSKEEIETLVKQNTYKTILDVITSSSAT